MRAFATLTALCVASVAAQQTEPAVKPTLRFDASPYLRGALGGAAYGLAASSISHPFDTIKTRLQTKTAVGGSASVLSRVLGLYRGVGPATAASILFRTVPFIGYEATRSMLRSHRLLESQPLLAALLGGAVGGVMRGCVETPAELAKTRLQVGAGLGSASLLLRGLRSTCLRNAAVIGLFWVAYEASATRRAALPPTLAAFVGGGGCSVLAWASAAIYPLDTAKSCIQAGAVGTSTSVWFHLAAIYRTHGVRGWYAGLGPGLLRAFLANGGGMALYSFVLTQLAAGTAPQGVQRGLRSPSPKSRAAFATAASSGVRTIQGELQGKLEAVDEKRQGVKAKAGGVVQGVKNKAKTKVLETALHKAGVELLQALTKDKWMPQPVHQSITNMFRSVWPEVEAVLFDLLYETMDSSQPKKDKKDKKRPWPAAPPSKREQPLRWFRARVVYAIFPADATFWHKVRQPDLLLFLVLLVVPYFGIATLMWLILLVFIDWDCDFQLINYIALQRATAFFVFGLLPACKGFVGYAVCINDMAFDPLACDHEGPGVSQSAMIKFARRQAAEGAGPDRSRRQRPPRARPAQSAWPCLAGPVHRLEQGEGEVKGIRGKVAKGYGKLADKRTKGYEKLVEQRQFTKFKASLVPRFGKRPVYADTDADANADADADAEALEANGGATEEEKAAASIQARLRSRNSRRQMVDSQSGQSSTSTTAVEVAPLSPRSSLRQTGTGFKIPKILSFRRQPAPSPRM